MARVECATKKGTITSRTPALRPRLPVSRSLRSRANRLAWGWEGLQPVAIDVDLEPSRPPYRLPFGRQPYKVDDRAFR